jgi:hypothetical protein
MALRRRKSRTDRIAGAVGKYAKFKVAKKAAKSAGRAGKWVAAYKVGRRTPVVGGLPVLVAAGIAAALAARKLRGGATNSA